MRRLKGFFFELSPDFSAEMTRKVEISTLSAHQMAHGGVVPHSSSWTPAAYELGESSPPLDSHIGGLPEPPDGEREQGDNVVYILMGLTAGNTAGYRGGVINTGIEDILVLPAISVVPSLPGPALRDGFSHVLGLCSRGVAASFWPAVAAAAIFRRLIYSGAYLSFSPVLFHSQREGALRSGRSAVLTAFVRVCFQAVVDHIHHRLTSRGVSVYRLQSFGREAEAPDVEPRGQRPKLQAGI